MQFTPKTEKEIAEEGMLPPGEYDFEIIKATEKISKKNNPMIEVLMWAYGPDGDRVIVTDYLLESIAYKLRHFCAAIGKLADYEAGTLSAAELVGLAGKFKLKVSKPNDDFPQKNEVKDYVIAKNGEVAPFPAGVGVGAEVGGDDIPF